MSSLIYTLLSNNINSFISNVSSKYNIPLYSLINDWNMNLDIDIKFENVCKECDKPLKNKLCWPCYNKHEIEKLEKHEECDKRGHFCEFEDCYYCFTRSFKMCEKSRYWSKKNKESPRMVSLNANKKYLFDCFNCGHEFSKELGFVTRGRWCPYCCYTTQKLCDNEDCKHCFNNSFASNPKSKYWSDKNIDEEGKFISPRSVIKGSTNIKRILIVYVVIHMNQLQEVKNIVHIVLNHQENYVIKKIVNNVLKRVLHQIQNQSIGVVKIRINLEMYFTDLLLKEYLIVNQIMNLYQVWMN